MLIEALVTLTAPHPDGPPKTVDHPPGSVLDLPDGEAKALIAGRYAQALKGGVAAVALRSSTALAPEEEPVPEDNPAPEDDPGAGADDPPADSPAAPAEPAGAPPAAPAPESGGDPDDAIRDAFELLEADNAAHWTADGRPDVRALAAIVGRAVKAADRDRLWAARHGD